MSGLDHDAHEPGEEAGHDLVGLWVNGESTDGDGTEAVLRIESTDWTLVASLGTRSPFAAVYALAMQLPDGRMLHGRAQLVRADGERLLFRGIEPLGGTIPR